MIKDEKTTYEQKASSNQLQYRYTLLYLEKEEKIVLYVHQVLQLENGKISVFLGNAKLR